MEEQVFLFETIIQFCSQNQMVRPIQFRKNEQINLNLLKLELDRRFNIITQMIKRQKAGRSCHDPRSKVQDSFCQTQQLSVPLSELTNLSLCKTPSMRSLKSPVTIKRSSSRQNKQNIQKEMMVGSRTSILNKNKKNLNPIYESEQEVLKTSKFNKKLESQSKNQKKNQTNKSKKSTNENKVNVNQLNDSFTDVLNSFESTKKIYLSTRKNFNSYCKQYSEEKSCLNLSLKSSIPDDSGCKSIVYRRKDSINDSFCINHPSKIKNNDKKTNQSILTNNFSISFQGTQSFEQPLNTGPKRITISNQVRLKILSQTQSKIQGKTNKKIKQPIFNNLRISLLKKLQDKHLKNKEVAN